MEILTTLHFHIHTILLKNLIDSFRVSAKGFGDSYVKIPALRIDYILHEEQFNSTNYQKHNEILSDHYAISCEIIIP